VSGGAPVSGAPAPLTVEWCTTVSVLRAAQGQMYQDLSAWAATIHELFVVILATSAESYLATEAAVWAVSAS
jgi:PE family